MIYSRTFGLWLTHIYSPFTVRGAKCAHKHRWWPDMERSRERERGSWCEAPYHGQSVCVIVKLSWSSVCSLSLSSGVTLFVDFNSSSHTHTQSHSHPPADMETIFAFECSYGRTHTHTHGHSGTSNSELVVGKWMWMHCDSFIARKKWKTFVTPNRAADGFMRNLN